MDPIGKKHAVKIGWSTLHFHEKKIFFFREKSIMVCDVSYIIIMSYTIKMKMISHIRNSLIFGIANIKVIYYLKVEFKANVALPLLVKNNYYESSTLNAKKGPMKTAAQNRSANSDRSVIARRPTFSLCRT